MSIHLGIAQSMAVFDQGFNRFAACAMTSTVSLMHLREERMPAESLTVDHLASLHV